MQATSSTRDAAGLLGGELVALVRRLRELASAAAVDGLELTAVSVLGRVADDGPLRLSALAGLLALDLSTVSRQVSALEASGLLERTGDPADRRAVLLRLTPQGTRALAARRAEHARLLSEALPGWDEDELRGLAAGLHRLNDDLARAREARTGVRP